MMRRATHFIGQLVLLIALIGCALLPTGCSRAPSQAEQATPTPLPTPIVPVKPTYEVQRGEVVKIVQFTGRIAPVVEEELFFRTAGYVEALYVERNDHVQAGDLLAELETSDLQNQLAQARADLEAVQFSFERQLAEAQASLKIAELRLEQAHARFPELTAAISAFPAGDRFDGVAHHIRRTVVAAHVDAPRQVRRAAGLVLCARASRGHVTAAPAGGVAHLVVAHHGGQTALQRKVNAESATAAASHSCQSHVHVAAPATGDGVDRVGLDGGG